MTTAFGNMEVIGALVMTSSSGLVGMEHGLEYKDRIAGEKVRTRL